ncbi:MAG TPA: MauE/DoxX family redox-associated membrane protein [Pilimelia sp.]|nr:MauE/DoxX family redox-associated membrane protein [Pilimelia sp.]
MTVSERHTDVMRTPRGRWAAWQPWLTVAARAGLAAVWLVAGASKVTDLAHSGRVVNAYQVMPYELAKVVGAMLPFVELALGVLLLAGLATRALAGVSAVLLVAFVAGIGWAWSQGLRIDCGCFGGGGELGAGEEPTYLLDLIRDGGFLLLSGFLLIWPRGWLAVDNWLRDDPQLAGRRPSARIDDTEPQETP